MRLKATAIQKGLSSYRWVISENGIPVVNTSSSSDEIERAFNRPGASAPDLLTVFSLDTRNFANCVSLPSSTLVTVPKRDAINAGFTVTPAIQTLPNATVTISNTTNPGPWTYLWDFGDGTTSTNPSPGSHIYSTYGVYVISLTVDNKECVERFSETVTILAIPPVVDFSFNPPSGCVPLTVDFTNLTQYADASKYRWDFGDGETSTEVNPTHVYKRQGTYSVSLEATNSTGAAILEVKANIITAHPRPVASFDVKPKLISIPGGLLYTSNLSFDATIFLWDFGDGNTSEDFRPEHAYQQEGIYTVRLRASNQFGCLDSASLVSAVRTQKSGQVLVPNAFSPSSFGGSSVGGGGVPTGDGKNDTFLPVMRGVTEFEMLVFNRWGELLFETKDATRGWDGSYNGKLCQQDVYMYKVIARFENGETVVRVGDINLIR
jgi:gliding motility-associated-like protein